MNDAEAYKWFLLTAAKENKQAPKYLTIFEGVLTAEQRAEGQRRAAAYHAEESK